MTAILTVDYLTSTVTVGGRRLPCVALTCPQDEPATPEPEPYQRTLGGPSRATKDSPKAGFDAYLPCENGLYVAFTMIEGEPTISEVDLVSPVCELTRHWDADEPRSIWLPIHLGLQGATLVPVDRGERWRYVEADWFVELFDRVGRLPVPRLEGPCVLPIRLHEIIQLAGYDTP